MARYCVRYQGARACHSQITNAAIPREAGPWVFTESKINPSSLSGNEAARICPTCDGGCHRVNAEAGRDPGCAQIACSVLITECRHCDAGVATRQIGSGCKNRGAREPCAADGTQCAACHGHIARCAIPCKTAAGVLTEGEGDVGSAAHLDGRDIGRNGHRRRHRVNENGRR